MKAEYIDHMGDDLRVVNAARVSFDKESEWFVPNYDGMYSKERATNRTLSDKDKKLIKYLASHNHWTPFSHCSITLRETVPIFVARQRFKHTVGFTYNEVSRRYVDDDPEFYYPKGWRERAANKKQGSTDTLSSLSEDYNDSYREIINSCYDLYSDMIGDNIAPEQARMVLPQSMYTSYYVTGSLPAFSRAYNLRSDPHAQQEIRELATMWNDIINPLFPISWAALTTKE